MGMNLLGRNCYTNETQAAPNPDSFTVRRQEVVGSNWVALIHYPGCTNFEGHKVIVGTGLLPSERTSLDPHFESGGDIIARFAPTEQGYARALAFAQTLGS